MGQANLRPPAEEAGRWTVLTIGTYNVATRHVQSSVLIIADSHTWGDFFWLQAVTTCIHMHDTCLLVLFCSCGIF